MNITEARKQIENDQFEKQLTQLYGQDVYGRQKKRYLSLMDKFQEKFVQDEISIISTPGRTELAGNHTDHNHGCVLAGSIQLDSLAVAAASGDPLVKVYSEGFPDIIYANIESLDKEPENEHPTSALLRGVLAIFKERGLEIGGFNAFISSDVLIGSGLSSSASIEVLLGKILGTLFNDDSVDSVDLAIIGQKAENVYLKKPCGLMDQVACAFGGIVAIDFKDPSEPEIESIHYSFEDNGYKLLVIDTGGDHADLTDDYAAIPEEMMNIASSLGGNVIREISENQFYEKIPELAAQSGDRAVLRTLHFLRENERVGEMVSSLKDDDLASYLKGVQASGDSSYKYLQNVFTPKHPSSQKVSLAIGLTEFYKKFDGAVRVHGGGFAGTVQVYIKNELFEDYKKYMEHFFGTQSVTPLKIRQVGACKVL